jgi:predicted 3-demethylubiquinone-9 3-methyltransferase (glyoxalase superfamily)
VEFMLEGQEYVALNGGPEFPFTEAVSFQVSCEDQEEVDRFWARLLEDGGTEGPCGWIKDRFGLSWQVIPTALPKLLSDPDQGRAQRAMAAMLQMTKIDVAAVERAADGG